MSINIEQLTPEQKRRISVAYLASGNSINDLCEQLIAALHPGVDSVDEFFQEILKDMLQQREEAPESFETTAAEELESLLNTEKEHEYEYNSVLWS